MELFAEQVLPVISSDVATPAPAGA
jgi:hypothetical protein